MDYDKEERIRNSLFCKVLREALWGGEVFEVVSPAEYEQLHRELQEHAISDIPANILRRLPGLPKELYEVWRAETLTQIPLFLNYLQQQDSCIALLKMQGIPCAVLKGAASAKYYPIPEYRQMGDIDLLISPADKEKAHQALQECGYCKIECDRSVQAFKKDDLVVEIHTGFETHRNDALTEKISALLLNDLRKPTEIELLQYRFPTLSPECTGVLLLAHMAKHFEKELGFRQVIDWMLYADKVLTDEVWQNTMQKLLQSYQLEQFAVTVTAMCQRYFGLHTQKMTWCAQADPELCMELFEHIWKSGNMGRNLKGSHSGMAKILRRKSLWEMVSNLQERGFAKWEYAHQHPAARPFAWAYQIRFLLKLYFSSDFDRSLATVAEDRKWLVTAENLAERLHLQ